jgi:anti-sigma-K factor RskA
MRLPGRDLHALTGAYALDAIDAGAEYKEYKRFTRHLDRCRSCVEEVRGFREVATTLAFATAAEPPPGLRARVMAAVARTPQAPPQARPQAQPGPGLARTWVPWLSGAVAMAGIVLAVVFGFAQARTEQQLNQERAQNQAIAAVLAAPDARLISQRTGAGGVATVVLDAARHELIVTTSGLPSLPAGKVYQLWLIGPKKVTPAGLLPPASSGRTPPVLASGLAAGDKLAMTVEPVPGTAQPTTTPIIAVQLPS